MKMLAGTLVAMLALAPLAAQATSITHGTTGLSSPDTLIDFDSLTPHTVLSNQLAGQGVTFSDTLPVVDTNGISELSASQVLNTSNNSNGNFTTINFLSPVSEAGFFLITNAGTTTFSAFLNGALVEQFATSTSVDGVLNDFYGFTGITFDRLTFQISAFNTAYNLDDLQYKAAVPEPATLALFGLGLAGLGVAARRRKTH